MCREKIIHFVENMKSCIIYGRVFPENDNFTCGRSAVDYFYQSSVLLICVLSLKFLLLWICSICFPYKAWSVGLQYVDHWIILLYG